MRPLFIILIVSLVVLQHKLWLGDGNLIQWQNLEKNWQLTNKKTINLQLVIEHLKQILES